MIVSVHSTWSCNGIKSIKKYVMGIDCSSCGFLKIILRDFFLMSKSPIKVEYRLQRQWIGLWIGNEPLRNGNQMIRMWFFPLTDIPGCNGIIVTVSEGWKTVMYWPISKTLVQLTVLGWSEDWGYAFFCTLAIDPLTKWNRRSNGSFLSKMCTD